MNVIFSVFKRDNSYKKKGYDWALRCKFDDDQLGWVMKTWDTKPCNKTIKDAQAVILRSFEVYHSKLTIPPFSIKVMEKGNNVKAT